MIKNISAFLVLCWLLLFCGCASDISVRQVERRTVFNSYLSPSGNGLLPATSNLLADQMLLEAFDRDPAYLMSKLSALFLAEPRPAYLAALADTALNIGFRSKDEPDKAVNFFLSAAYFSHAYLTVLDDLKANPYSADRIQILSLYNTAATELFAYLKKQKLYRKSSYSIGIATGHRVTFHKPEFSLPLPEQQYSDFLLCADFETRNLTHTTTHFGIGVPLICELISNNGDGGQTQRFAKDQMLPATLVIKFDSVVSEGKLQKINAKLCFLNSREQHHYIFNNKKIPLAMDFSTPTAYMAKKPLPFGYLSYMLFPAKSKAMQGLYKFEPANSKRIPVVLVHGLMSNTRTWMQMLNTLQNDPDLRRHYQFWGFSYSSGNPIITSAQQLRRTLRAEREKLLRAGQSVEMFDRMVIIGHSMGGLLTKTTMIDTDGRLLKKLLAKAEKAEKLTPKQLDFLKSHGLEFSHLPFVKRVIFIAVPHGGSKFATSFIGRLGSALIQLPETMISQTASIIKTMFPDNPNKVLTGIDNLVPDNRILAALRELPFVKGIPYHSIVGNIEQADTVGGTDGIVPYWSSHLDGAASELVVKSNHSVQQNPLAIQEVRRILLEHLKSYPDIKMHKPKLPGKLAPAREKL